MGVQMTHAPPQALVLQPCFIMSCHAFNKPVLAHVGCGYLVGSVLLSTVSLFLIVIIIDLPETGDSANLLTCTPSDLCASPPDRLVSHHPEPLRIYPPLAYGIPHAWFRLLVAVPTAVRTYRLRVCALARSAGPYPRPGPSSSFPLNPVAR
jgi:hypothetical protein